MKTELFRIVQLLEMDPQVLNELDHCHSYEELRSKFDLFKSDVEVQRKRLAKKYHPDLGGDIERMKVINEACDRVKKMIVERPSPPPMFDIRVYSSGTNMGTTQGSPYGPIRMRFNFGMRVQRTGPIWRGDVS